MKESLSQRARSVVTRAKMQDSRIGRNRQTVPRRERIFYRIEDGAGRGRWLCVDEFPMGKTDEGDGDGGKKRKSQKIIGCSGETRRRNSLNLDGERGKKRGRIYYYYYYYCLYYHSPSSS